jgi:predicted aldo/keto reductase-like oxidoreductase
MEKRALGKTGLEVSELGLGGLFVAPFASPQDGARAMVSRALDPGINYLDGRWSRRQNGAGRSQPFKLQDPACLGHRSKRAVQGSRPGLERKEAS